MDKEKFLPVGTVVLLKNGKKPLMIVSYCIMPAGDVYDKNGKVENPDKVLDYGACSYPEGIVTANEIYGFNHDKIDKILHMGYETDEQKEISKVLLGGLEEMKKEEVEDNK